MTFMQYPRRPKKASGPQAWSYNCEANVDVKGWTWVFRESRQCSGLLSRHPAPESSFSPFQIASAEFSPHHLLDESVFTDLQNSAFMPSIPSYVIPHQISTALAWTSVILRKLLCGCLHDIIWLFRVSVKEALPSPVLPTVGLFLLRFVFNYVCIYLHVGLCAWV